MRWRRSTGTHEACGGRARQRRSPSLPTAIAPVSAVGGPVGVVCRVERLRREVGIYARLDADIGQPLDTGKSEAA